MRRLAVLLSLLLGAAALAAPPTASAQPHQQLGPSTARYLVVTSPSSMASLRAALPARVAADPATKRLNAIGTVVADLTEAEAAELDARPGTTVSRDQTVHASDTPGSWGQDRSDDRSLPLDNDYTPPGGGTVDGAGADAYIIDTGIAVNHAGFSGRVGPGYDFVGLDDDPSECPGSEPHGTHVAGTVGSDLYGIAPGVTLHGVRVLNCEGSGSYATVAQGVNYVVAQSETVGNTVVGNMSLGGPRNEAFNQVVTNAVNAGVVMVVAAGNEADDADFYSPASTPEAITVAASNRNDVRAAFSNYGPRVDLFAPGVDISSIDAFNPEPNVPWTISGTSMATPHVTGWVALYLSEHLVATPTEVESALITMATPGKISDPAGSPNLLMYTEDIVPQDPGDPTPPPNAPSFVVNRVTGSSITVTWTPPTEPNGTIEAYRWTWISENGKPVKRWTRIYDAEEIDNPFTFTNLASRNTYTISLEAINENGIGEPYVLDVKTGAPAILPPSAPRYVHGRAGNHKARVSWTAPSRGPVDAYQVRRYNAGTRTLPASARTTLFTGLRNRRTYTFDVRAHNKSGWGAWSAVVRIRPHR